MRLALFAEITAILCFVCVSAQAQTSGGTFNITHSVTASGGETMTGTGGFKMDGTVAQPGVGDDMSNPPFVLKSGFWNPLFAPTAASASIGGQVVNMKGAPIKNVVITMTGGNMFAPRTAR